MNTSANHVRSVKHTDRKPGPSMSGHLALIAGAIIAVCSSGSFAQTSMVTNAPQTEATATRPRKLTPDLAGKDGTTTASVERPAAAPTERRVFVRSTSLLVRAAVVEDKLLKRPEFQELGFVITRDESEADMILELRHDLFTKYVFSVVDTRSQVVVASGKLSSLGGTVGGKVAKRFVKEMRATRGP